MERKTSKGNKINKTLSKAIDAISNNIVDVSPLLETTAQPYNPVTEMVKKAGRTTHTYSVDSSDRHYYEEEQKMLYVPPPRVTSANKVIKYKASIPAQKLFYTGLRLLPESKNGIVNIPLVKYAIANGLITEHELDDNPQKTAEKLYNFTKLMSKAVDELFSLSFKIKEQLFKGSKIPVNSEYRFLQAKAKPVGGYDGYITMHFTDVIQQEIQQTKVFNYFSEQLLDIPNNDENLFSVISAIYENYHKFSNWSHPTVKNKHEFMKVSTLLEHTTLPTLEECKRKRQSSNKVIELFLDILERAVQQGKLIKYEFIHKDGSVFTDTDMKNLSYTVFYNSRIRFYVPTEISFIKKLITHHEKKTTPKKRGRPKKEQ